MNFFRRAWNRHSKFGLRRKKVRKWRRPTGRDNKIRERRRGYPARVSIGYQTERKTMDLVRGKVPIYVNNVKDLGKVGKDNIVVIAHVGKKKREEIVKQAKEKKFTIYNKLKIPNKPKEKEK
jgi:large subunit ribosomal protein L32e